MKVLITGGKGFIGSHLVRKLVGDGHEVTVISKTTEVPFNLMDIKFLSISGSYSDIDLLDNILPSIDIVFHLAWSSVPRLDLKEIEADITNNVNGTIRLLNSCVHFKKKIIFISSGGTVYGLPQTTLLGEEHPLNPISYYGIGKVCIEKYLHMYGSTFNLDYCIFRVSNAYGPQQNLQKGQGVLSIWLKDILLNKHIEVWGDGSIVRDYIHVSDVVNVLSSAVVYKHKYRIYNLGSGVGISLIDIISLIKNLITDDFTTNFKESRSIDVPSCVLDISKLGSETGFSTSVSLVSGLQSLWHYIVKTEFDS